MDVNKQKATRERFGLRDGQLFASPLKKNLHWEINGEFFGFGDLRHEDVERIQAGLSDREVFQGWNEHHFTQWKHRDTAIILITKDEISFLPRR